MQSLDFSHQINLCERFDNHREKLTSNTHTHTHTHPHTHGAPSRLAPVNSVSRRSPNPAQLSSAQLSLSSVQALSTDTFHISPPQLPSLSFSSTFHFISLLSLSTLYLASILDILAFFQRTFQIALPTHSSHTSKSPSLIHLSYIEEALPPPPAISTARKRLWSPNCRLRAHKIVTQRGETLDISSANCADTACKPPPFRHCYVFSLTFKRAWIHRSRCRRLRIWFLFLRHTLASLLHHVRLYISTGSQVAHITQSSSRSVWASCPGKTIPYLPSRSG